MLRLLSMLLAICLSSCLPVSQPKTEPKPEPAVPVAKHENKDDEAGISSVAIAYFKTPKQDRWKLIADGDKIKEKISLFWEQSRAGNDIPEQASVDSIRMINKDTAIARVSLSGEIGGRKVQTYRPCVAVRSGEEWKIDFDSTVGYNKLSLMTISNLGGKENYTARVKVKIEEDVPARLRGFRDRYYILNLKDVSGQLRSIVDKNTPAGKAIFELVKDGTSRDVVVEFSLILNTSERFAVVKELLSDTWVFPNQK